MLIGWLVVLGQPFALIFFFSCGNCYTRGTIDHPKGTVDCSSHSTYFTVKQLRSFSQIFSHHAILHPKDPEPQYLPDKVGENRKYKCD